MQIQLRKSSTDSDMLEIVSIENEKTFLWAVCHFDFVYTNQKISKRLKEGESIIFKLEEIEK